MNTQDCQETNHKLAQTSKMKKKFFKTEMQQMKRQMQEDSRPLNKITGHLSIQSYITDN